MSYCLKPSCLNPKNPANALHCQSCKSRLLLAERFRGIRPLGQGGFARTLLGQDEQTNQVCVIKQFSPPIQRTKNIQRDIEFYSEQVRRFRLEAEHLAHMEGHPQIPSFFAHFEQDYRLYLVQEYVEGLNLLQEVEERGPLKETDIFEVLMGLLPILDFIHQQRIIHRDLKPSNIIRRQDRTLVLLDFGIAKLLDDPLSHEGATVIGTPGYSAPEQLVGRAVFASDLFGLGATCLHLLLGQAPHIFFRDHTYNWTGLWQQQRSLNSDLVRVLDKLLQLEVRDRYPNAQAALQDLQGRSPTATKLTKFAQVALPSFLVARPKPLADLTFFTPTEPEILRPRELTTLTGHRGEVHSVAFSPDGQTLASGGQDGTIRLWSLAGGSLGRLLGHLGPVRSITFLPGSHHQGLLVSGGFDRTIRLWDIALGKAIHLWQDHQRWLRTVVASPDGIYLASGGGDHVVRVWNLLTRELSYELLGHQDEVTCIAFTKEGLISGSWDGTLRFWSLPGGTSHVLNAHASGILSLALSHNEQILVTASSDHSLKIWDTATQQLRQTLNGHQDEVNTVVLQESQILSGSRDHSLMVWDLQSGKCLHTLMGHQDRVYHLATHPEQLIFASASRDGTIRIWETQPS